MPREEFEKEILLRAKELATFEDETLLNFAIAEICDRVSLNLNLPEGANFDKRLVRILANITCGAFAKFQAVAAGEASQAIASVSDNGQSVSYRNSARNYFSTAEDGEIFGGYAKLLAPFRRVNVVS